VSAIVETVGVDEACALLRVSKSTLYRRVKAGIVPGAKPGRELTFIRDDLLAYIRSNYKQPCSIDVRDLRTGTSDLNSTDANSGSLLARQIALKRKNLKPRLEIVPGGKSGSASSL
jgi:excisionase family DNA binding protein